MSSKQTTEHACFHCGAMNRFDACWRCGLWQSKKDTYPRLEATEPVQQTTGPHPICDVPALYDRGNCCGQTPCAVLDAPFDGAVPKPATAIVRHVRKAVQRDLTLREAVAELREVTRRHGIMFADVERFLKETRADG